MGYCPFLLTVVRCKYGGIEVGGDSVNKIDEQKCVPFVSQYSDCTDGSLCNDCTLCTCNAKSEWECKPAKSCSEVFRYAPRDENSLQQAFNILETEIDGYDTVKDPEKPDHQVPTPEDDDLLVKVLPYLDKPDSLEDNLKALLRMKRSTKEIKGRDNNKTVNFYHTLDDVNEDTLKNNNTEGTLVANKMDLGLKISRRTDVFTHNNTNSLQIEHKKPIQHITDNKLDENVQIDPNLDEKIHKVIGNTLAKEKDKKLSKLIVNELKPGTEIIGDKRSTIMSNVTFAPENDTLVAMAYIAGNLLNKLWNIEKDVTSESFETEVLKHEKISDLIELFKEPLSLRQETFLRNALEQLSSAVNKNNGENLNICESITKNNPVTEKQEEINVTKNCNLVKKSDRKENISQEAVDKIMNVLNLMSKYEQFHKNLTTKTNATYNKDIETLESKLDLLSQDETASLNTFGGILEKITKLLMPNKTGKKMANKIKYQNIFSHPNDFKKKFKTLYNLDLSNITISTKDKLIMDYLTHIEKNPDCLLNEKAHRHETKSVPQLEGDILFNLSEFFKIQSYADIIHLLDNKSRPESVKKKTFHTTEHLESMERTIKVLTEKVDLSSNDEKLALAKDTLKKHLKTVLEDLIALQNASGGSNSTDIKMSDALPCIYNLLYKDKKQLRKTGDKSLKNIKAVFDYFKNETLLPSTRKFNVMRQRPKSAAVWERIVKNLDDKANSKTRRNMELDKSKTFDEIKHTIEKTESSGSNTYKNIALISEVPSADRLSLLQTLNADVKRYQKILEDMKVSLVSNSPVSKQYLKDFIEFVDNVAININLNEKIIKNLNKPKSKTFVDKINSKTNVWQNKFINKKSSRFTETRQQKISDDNIRLTRDQILDHLIKNRIKVYLKAKEADDSYNNDDINYGIARKILMYLERGNVSLARELFKTFAGNKQNDSKGFKASPPLVESRLSSIVNKVPLLQFEDQIAPSTNDLLLKQLMNIKNMRM